MRAGRARTLVLLAGVVGGLGAAPAHARIARVEAPSVPGQVLVQFAPGTSGSERAGVREAAGARARRALRQTGMQLLEVQDGTTVGEAIRRLQDSPRVRFAQPNLVYRAATNDPDFPAQWGLAAIGAPQAWQSTLGSPAVTVAVVDSGIASDHPELDAAVDVARSRDFVDDEVQNSLSDPARDDGFDPVGDPRDLDGHGTHVAGIIGAEANNGIGIAGVAAGTRLVSVRVLDGHGSGESDDIADGLDYAGAIGAQVANVSISGPGLDQAVASAIRAHPGTLYVAAAGNGGGDDDRAPQSPCNVDAPNLVCVAATTFGDGLAGFSNFGHASVDLGAPGQAIRSTVPARAAPVKTWRFEGSSPLADWNPNYGWALSTAFSVGGNGHSVTDSAAGLYATNQNTSLITNAALDLRDERGCVVDYALRLDTQPGDLMRVMTTSDRFGASTFITQDSWSGSTHGAFEGLRTYLDADGQQPLLRLNLLANGDGAVADGAYVDDVSVSCLADPDPGAYQTLDGTSMAAPHVSGVAALIWAARPGSTVAAVRCDLLGGGAPVAALAATTVSGRRLDAARAVSGAASATPAASTLDAAGVAGSGATLRGIAYPCGAASAYQFEYGPTAAYGAVAPATPAALPSGADPTEVGAAVGGLAAGTTYHFRLVTIRDGVRHYGADRAFTTAPAPVAGGSPRALTLRDVLASCKRSGRGRRRTVTCTLRRASAVRRLSARLTKRGRVYARASGRPPRSGRVRLKLVRRLPRGRYRVTLTLRDARGAKRTKRMTVRV